MRKKKSKQSGTKDINQRFSMLCRYYRSKNSLTVTELAEKLGCSKSMVESYENLSDVRGPGKSYETLQRLAFGLDMTPISLIHILEGRANEELEQSDIVQELSTRFSHLSTKSVSNILHLLDFPKDQLTKILDLSVKLSNLNSSDLETVIELVGMKKNKRSIALSVVEQLSSLDKD